MEKVGVALLLGGLLITGLVLGGWAWQESVLTGLFASGLLAAILGAALLSVDAARP